MIMEPFNMVINADSEQIELHIHPQESRTYKIVYLGALIGEIFLGSDGETWQALTADELQPGGFPVYEFDETSGHQDILLNEDTVQEIGRRIPR